MACTEKTVNPYLAIDAKYVVWGSTEPPFSTNPSYYQVVLQQVATNSNHDGYIKKKGKLRQSYFDATGEECEDKKEVLYFKVSVDANNNALTDPGMLVARPCPPFCESGGDEEVSLEDVFPQSGIKEK